MLMYMLFILLAIGDRADPKAENAQRSEDRITDRRNTLHSFEEDCCIGSMLNQGQCLLQRKVPQWPIKYMQAHIPG